MFKKIISKKILAVFTLAVVITASTAAVYGADLVEKIQATIRKDYKITLNGERMTPRDASGNEVYPVIINGSTYLPVRAIANLVDLNVAFDANTNTIGLSTKDYVPVDESGFLQEVELNDDRENANSFPLDKTMKGYVGGKTALGTDSEDMFKIEVPSEGILTLALTSNETINAKMTFFGQGTTGSIFQDGSGIMAERKKEITLQKGVYYVKVNSSKPGEYKLKNEFSPLKEQTEPNDDRENAYELTMGQPIYGFINGKNDGNKTDNEDYYKFTVGEEQATAGETSIIVEGSMTTNPKITLFKESSTGSLKQDGSGIFDKREIKLKLEVGTYYVKVSASEQGDYTLTVK